MAKILALLFLLTSCTSIPDAVDTSKLYKRDMVLDINGRLYHGVAAPTPADRYRIHVYAKGDLDLFTLETCHREESTEQAWNVIKRKGLFKRKIRVKNEVEFTYSPTNLEKTTCPILLGGYDKKHGRHSWAFIYPQETTKALSATLLCNGKKSTLPTVSVCQSKRGLVQSIEFEESVIGICEEGCGLEDKTRAKSFSIALAPGRCACLFKADDGRMHKLVTIGYDEILIRE